MHTLFIAAEPLCLCQKCLVLAPVSLRPPPSKTLQPLYSSLCLALGSGITLFAVH